MRRTARYATTGMAACLALSLVATPPTARADSLADPYGSDPLGLIAHYGLTSRAPISAGVIEVWVCEKVGGGLPVSDLTPEQLLEDVEKAVSEFWNLESGGGFEISLEAEGSVEVEGLPTVAVWMDPS